MLAEWVATASLPVAWLSLDAEDNNANHFLRYLVAALETTLTEHEKAAFKTTTVMLQAVQPPPIQTSLVAFINDITEIPVPFTLVLDDYQWITKPTVNENKGTWRVMEIDNQRTIVLYSARDFIDGIEFDPNKARPSKIYGITSWVFYIHPVDEKQARLLIRVRAELGPGVLMALVGRIVFGLGDAVFERTILQGIKTRVEGYS